MSRIVIALVLALGLFGGYSLLSKGNVEVASTSAQDQAAAYLEDLYAQNPPTVSGDSTTQTASAGAAVSSTMEATTPNNKVMKATLHTSEGDVTIEFMADDAPNTVANFVKLAKDGFYNGTKFHRVISGFMIQGGDPLTKDDTMQARWGTGDPGYKFADEIHAHNKNMAGTIAMANSGPNTNGSQFFINVANNNFLDPKHTVFGKVTAGMDIVSKIEKTETNASDRPLTPIVIESVTLE